jgi:hypothetical protein
MFAAAAAPAIVRAESLMKIYVPPQEMVFTPNLASGVLVEGDYYDALSGRYTRNLAKSTILTRQQIIERMLPELNKLFNIEYDRYTENRT